MLHWWRTYHHLKTRWFPRWSDTWTPRLALHLRERRGRRRYVRCGPLRSSWGRWKLVRVESGSGGPYAFDTYYWAKHPIGPLRREVKTRVYTVPWAG